MSGSVVTDPIVIGVFVSVFVTCVVLLVLYFRWRRPASAAVQQRDQRGQQKSVLIKDEWRDELLFPRSSRLSARGSTEPYTTSSMLSPAQKRVQRGPVDELQDWGPVVCYGIDIGSFMVKTHVMRDGKLQELPSLRAVATVADEGVVFGDLDVALEHADKTLFALPRDMVSEGSAIQEGDVVMTPFQAVGGLIAYIVGDRIDMPPVGVCLPPYLSDNVYQQLYLAAHAASLQRFFIFRHSAALIAALLRNRHVQKVHKTKPPRNVVFVDMGRSGIVAYVCEVRDTAGSVRYVTHRSKGVQQMEAQMVMELKRDVTDEDSTTVACIVEAAREIREDFASIPEYLVASRKKSSVTIDEALTVEMSREIFAEVCDTAAKDVDAVCQDVLRWMQDNSESREECELVLVGQGFRIREFRWIWEQNFDRRRTSVDKVSVSQGLALLTAMQHPQYTGQRFDVYPLFQLPTVDEMGTRVVQDQGKTHSILTPLLGRAGSQLLLRRSNQSFGTNPQYLN